jgi:UDP-N-acetylmuramoyl-tripeptide--D-alanyl-D-alanine ligase
MEWLGSIEAIAEAKQELVEALPSGPQGVAILNKDDPLVMAMADHTNADIFTYGLDNTADLWADNINSMGLDGMHFTLHYGSDQLSLQVPLLGRHSVHTALRAAAVGLVEGLAWDEIIRGLRALSAQLRLVAVPGPKNSVILDDTYNSSPESAVAALNLLSDLDGRRLAVLGDMLELGPVEESSHRIVGRRARDVAQLLVTVGPRSELIAEEALAVGMPEDKVFITSTAKEAVPILEEIIEPSDVILVKASRGVGLDYIVSVLGQG